MLPAQRSRSGRLRARPRGTVSDGPPGGFGFSDNDVRADQDSGAAWPYDWLAHDDASQHGLHYRGPGENRTRRIETTARTNVASAGPALLLSLSGDDSALERADRGPEPLGGIRFRGDHKRRRHPLWRSSALAKTHSADQDGGGAPLEPGVRIRGTRNVVRIRWLGANTIW